MKKDYIALVIVIITILFLFQTVIKHQYEEPFPSAFFPEFKHAKSLDDLSYHFFEPYIIYKNKSRQSIHPSFFAIDAPYNQFEFHFFKHAVRKNIVEPSGVNHIDITSEETQRYFSHFFNNHSQKENITHLVLYWEERNFDWYNKNITTVRLNKSATIQLQ